jgi:cytochrome P450
MSPTEALVSYDPLGFYEDPYPIYRELRDAAPVYHNESRGAWVLSRYADVQAAARDAQAFSSHHATDIPEFSFGPGDFLDQDPPRHDALRQILRQHFLPKRLKLHEPEVRRRVERLLDALLAAGEGDFSHEFAQRLPLLMISHLFGVPASDQPLLENWFVRIVERVPGQEGEPADVAVASNEMERYVELAVAERMRQPRDDVLGALAGAIAAGELEPEEIFGLSRLLLIAGVHTTSTLIANSLLLLRERPADREMLRRSPELITGAIEELLRFDSPVQWLGRRTTRAVQVHDTLIPAGQPVVLLWASANRDGRRFENPDTLDLTRRPEHHMAFGQGIHFCLGAPLARLEARVALEILFRRVRDYQITGPVERLFTHNERGVARLPLAVQPF